MRGWVRSFLAERSYGFIDGEDGESYFFHLDDVRDNEPVAAGQEVTFRPSATPKGLRARSVIPGQQPRPVQLVYLEPDRFIMTREPEIRGHVIVQVVGQGIWYEANDPNQARDGLRNLAQRRRTSRQTRLALQQRRCKACEPRARGKREAVRACAPGRSRSLARERAR